MAKATRTKNKSGRKARSPHRVSQREVDSLSLVDEPKPLSSKKKEKEKQKGKKKKKKKKLTFWSLPKDVREQIYRQALVKDDSMDCFQDQGNPADRSPYDGLKLVPTWFEADPRVDREAAPIYFGENRFDLPDIVALHHLAQSMWPRHFKLVRKLRLKLEGGAYFRCETLRHLQRLKCIDELFIIVDEKHWLSRKLSSAEDLQWDPAMDIIPQLALRGYYMSGVPGLYALSGIRSVKFLADKNAKPDSLDFQGPLPGGFFETILKPHMMRSRDVELEPGFSDDASFRFLDLPAELRNRIYKLLLVFPGGVVPSTNSPSSVMGLLKNSPLDVRANASLPDSGLKILAVCRQIHQEAVGMFYGDNTLHFHYPIQFSTFLFSIGPDRSRFIRDVTLVYHNRTEGTIQTFESAIRSLRCLQALQKLQIMLRTQLTQGLSDGGYEDVRTNVYFARLHGPEGMRTLFTLRGLAHIQVRDLWLEYQLDPTSEGDFSDKEVEASRNMTEALCHFNSALAVAQQGNLNRRFFDDEYWHTRLVFPAICDCKEKEWDCTNDSTTCLQLPGTKRETESSD